MSGIAISDTAIAEETRAFAASIEECRSRWLYCLSRATFKETYRGKTCIRFNERTFPICDKILGATGSLSAYRLPRLQKMGFDAAERHYASIGGEKPYFRVGPFQHWNVGHVYFARVESFPHVVKIGFSRRVRERLNDIEVANKVRLFIRPGELKVGTMADEHWWHRDWRKHRIIGEWFFDPFIAERSLPDFLEARVEAA